MPNTATVIELIETHPASRTAALKFQDGNPILFGSGATSVNPTVSDSDVSLAWDGTQLELLPVADDTGAFNIGDGTTDFDFKIFLGATGDYALFDVGNKALTIAGDARIDLSSATIAAANTDGGVIKAGTSSARVIEDTASMKFISCYFDCGATSGGASGLYTRLYVTGAGGSGDAGRFFCTVEDVAGATARGAHISLSFGASGTVTGLGAALEATLHMPTTAGMAGTNYAIKAAINADGAASDPVGATTIAFIGINGQGDATGLLDLDTDGHLLDVTGMTAASGVTNMLSSTSLAELPTNVGLRVKINGDLYYIPCVAAAGWN